MAPKNNNYDGKRGFKGVGGWWVSVEEAKEYTVGKEAWWWDDPVNGAVVSVKQYDSSGPADKPIWMFYNGDMYLGEWKQSRKGHPVEHGYGATYIHNPGKYRGVVYVGEWKEGEFHGAAKAFWLESAPSWIKNELHDTGIKQREGNRLVSRPYTYIGNYVDNVETDDAAVVTLKDGTTRVGAWKAGKPVGDWWKDHQSAAAAPRGGRAVARARSRSKPALPIRLGLKVGSAKPVEKNSVKAKASRVKKEAAPKKKAARVKKEIPAPKKRAARIKNPARRPERDDSEGTRGEARVSRVYGVETANPVTPERQREEQKVVLTEESDREGEIAQWLHDVIGYNPNKEEMKEYSKKFVELGLHSSQMIKDLLPANRVATFFWMKEFHRQQFLSNANLRR